MIRDTSHQDAVIAPPRAHKLKRRALWAGAAILLAATGGALLAAWNGSEHAVSASRLRIAEVGRGTLVRDAAVNGRVVAAVSPTLYSTAPATVNLKVAAGDTVNKGDVLAVLESPDLTDALKREVSTYEQLKAEVARQQILAAKQKLLARREADTAEIERLSAQRTVERYDSVGTVGIIAKIDYQKAQDALNSAGIRARHAAQAASLEGDDVQLAISLLLVRMASWTSSPSRHAAQAASLEGDDVQLAIRTKSNEMERARLSMANAQRRVDELTVRAPVDGFVGTLNVQNRMVVAANAPLMTLVDLSRLEVEVEVPETYAGDLGLGMNAEITLPAGRATGKLSALSPEVVRNLVLARVRFDGEQPKGLRQSQRVSARLLIEEKPNVVMVQRGPFVENEGGRHAYVVQDGVAVRTPIQLGATSISAVEIVSGLKPGDRVVVAGTDAFDGAARVTIN